MAVETEDNSKGQVRHGEEKNRRKVHSSENVRKKWKRENVWIYKNVSNELKHVK